MIFFNALLTTFVATALGASILHKEIEVGHSAEDGKHQQDSSVHWPGIGAGDTEHHHFKIGNVAISHYVPHTEHLHDHDEEDKDHGVVIHIEVHTPHHSGEDHYDQQDHDLKHHWQHEDSEEDHHNLEHDTDSEEEHDWKHHLHPDYHHFNVNHYNYPDDQVLTPSDFGGQLQHHVFDPYHYYYGTEGYPSTGVHHYTGPYGYFPQDWTSHQAEYHGVPYGTEGYPSTGVHHYTGPFGYFPQDWTSHQAEYHGVPVHVTKHPGLVHYPHAGNTYGTNQKIQAQQREKIWHLLHSVSPTHATLKHVEDGNRQGQDYTSGQNIIGADVLHHPGDVHH